MKRKSQDADVKSDSPGPTAGTHRPTSASSSPPGLEWLASGGDMGKQVAAKDWSKTPLGPIEAWPQSLRTTVSLCLMSRFPMAVCWGREYVFVYNDGYSQILGAKHPEALGRPCFEVWNELAYIVRPMFDGVIATGEATWSDDLMLPMERHGYLEEAYFTVSYSGIRGESGRAEGILVTVTETTERFLAQRRLRLVRELGDASGKTRSLDQATEEARRILAAHPDDVPFSALYLIDQATQVAPLAGATGVEAGSPAAPRTVSLRDPAARPWPLARLTPDTESLTIEDLTTLGNLPGGQWPEPATRAILLPLMRPGHPGLTGVLVAGVNPRRWLDEPHVQFFALVARQVATAIANALAHEESKRQVEALAELDRVKTAFFSNVSHEFRTPLTLMLGPLEDALRNAHGVLPREVANDLALSHRNALRLLKLVNTMLDFSRIEAGRIQASYEPLDLAALTAELASNFRSACDKAGLELLVSCAPLDEPVYVDREMWEKIVLNLLSNAFKFTLAGRITVTLQRAGDHAELCIRDTGTGIPAGELERIFERFHRVRDARGRSFEGSGIGLALVQELAKLHGGTVRVASELGRGSTFIVSLPFGKGHLAADRISRPRAPTSMGSGASPYVEEALRWLPGAGTGTASTGGTPAVADTPEEVGGGVLRLEPLGPLRASGRRANATTPARVLLADDNADMREYLLRLLRQGQYEVTAVADGEAAFAAARAHPPDVILADVMMPRLDGFGLLQAIRADAGLSTTPVILVSARAGEEARVEGMEAGADDYLTKPFSARELLARVGAQVNLTAVRREADRALRESEERFRALTNATSDVVYRMSPDWMEMRQLRGREFIPDTLETSRKWLETYVPLDDQPTVLATIRRAIATRSVYQLEHRVIRVDGSIGWTHSRAIPILNESGEIIEWFGAASDVTQRKVAEERLRQANVELSCRLDEIQQIARELAQVRDQALAADRAKDEFLAALSHELRTPLSPVLLLASEAAADPGLPEEVRRDFEVIRRNINLEARLIDDLLDLTRLSRGLLKLDVQTCDVHRVLRDALDVVREDLAVKQLQLTVELGAVHGLVRGDAARLQQVFWNVLRNAAHFTPHRGRITVETRNDDASGQVVVAITDNGSGIDPDDLPRIFETFAQGKGANGAKRQFGGLGIGLAICRKLMQLHGGTIDAASTGRGNGATFTIRLPWFADVREEHAGSPGLAPAAASTSGDAASTPGAANLTPAARGRILLVEDHEPTRTTLHRMLERREFFVLSAGSAAEALNHAARHEFDVVLSDIGLPDRDGNALMMELRAVQPTLRGIALSGYGMEKDVAQAHRAGFSTHLTKPVNAGILEGALRQVLGDGSAAHQLGGPIAKEP